MPDVDPEKLRAALTPKEFDPDTDVDPDDENAVWLLGDDPEADITRISDNRAAIKRQLKSEGAQFVYGLLMLAGALGSLALALTIQTIPFIAIACVACPVGMWWFRARWKRWLGTAPYCYKLLTSLGEDAENVREAHENKQRQKYVRAVGDLYEHTRPKD
jgi:flagellar biosynthesis component FlhA